MSQVGPQDWLECIKPDQLPNGSRIRPGQVYRLAAIRNGLGWCCVGEHVSDAGIDIEGQPSLEHVAFCLCCFRPAGYRPTEEITRLLKAPKRVKEDA